MSTYYGATATARDGMTRLVSGALSTAPSAQVIMADPVVDDYAGNLTTTGSVAVGGSVSGWIETYNDQDWFRTSLSAGRIYAFDLKGSSSGGGTVADPSLMFMDGAGNYLGFDGNSGTGFDARLVYSPLSSGDFYLAVMSDGRTGTYTLAVTDLGADDFPGSDATTGTLGIGDMATGNIQFIDDQDWFRVELSAGRIYTFDMKGVDSGGGSLPAAYLRLLDGAADVLVSDLGGGTGADARLSFSPATTGSYYLAAQGLIDALGTYTLAAIDIGQDDHGANSATTGALVVGGTTTGEIQFNGDQDWFRVDLTAGRLYAFDMKGADSAGGTLADPTLRLFDGTETYLLQDQDSGSGRDARLTFGATASGSYFLSAQGTLDATGSYTLTATDLGADDYAGNPTTTGSLEVGGSVTGNIQIANDEDWFRIVLTAGQIYAFDLKGQDTASGTLANPHLLLRNGAGDYYLSADDNSGTGRDARITYLATSSGTHHLVARGLNDNDSMTGSYTLTATSLGVDDYAGDLSTTGNLVLGSSLSGDIQVPGEQDWIRIQLTAGRIYTFDLKGAASGGGTLTNPAFNLLDGSGNYLSQATQNGTGLDPQLTLLASTSGTYYLGIRGLYSSNTGTYTLLGADLGADDYAGNTATTGMLSPGGSLTGAIQLNEEQDWFRIELTLGTTYILQLQGVDSGNGTLANPMLEIRNAAGQYLLSDFSSGTGRDALLAYTPDSSGTYYLVARGNYNDSIGTYKLSVGLDDHTHSILTQGIVPIGGTANGTIEYPGDQDWFRVDLTAGTDYVFDLQDAAAGGGTLSSGYLLLLGADSAYLAGNASHLFFTPATSGSYYLAAQGVSATGTYTLSAVLDDFSGGIGTTGSLAMGGSVTGIIQGGSDQDWVAIALSAGQSYAFSLEGRDSGGGTLADPLLRLRDGAGNIIASNLDGGFGRDAHLTHIATGSGTYYLSVESQYAYGDETGTYTLSARALGSGYQATPVSNAIPLTGTATLDGLIQGSAWQFSGARVLTYSFNAVTDTGANLGGPWTETQQDAIREALLAWEVVANISFVEIPGSDTIEHNTADLAFGHVGSFLYPAAGLGLFPSPDFANQFLAEVEYSRAEYPRLEGDVLLDDYASEMQYLQPGDAGFWVGMHELGHALGLKHPFDDGGNGRPTFISLGIGAKDSRVWTAMSYDNPASSLTAGYTATPMLLDIQAIQRLYGADTSYHHTDNTYFLTDDGAVRTLWDTGGNDGLDASDVGGGIVLNLEAGSINPFGYQRSVVAIAYGVSIENARGGDGADTLTGTSAANLLDGGAGADTLIGGRGDDTYRVDHSGDQVIEYANEGTDTVESTISYVLGAHLEHLKLLGSTAINGTGNSLDNTLTGNDASNVLDGGSGRDTLIGGLGNDTYVVDQRGDTIIEFENQGSDSVHATLSWSLGAHLEHLALLGTNTFSATGNGHDNTLTGNTAGNILDGGSGRDTLIGGAGNDTYVVDNASDVIQETGADSSDTVRSWVDWTLGDNLENLILLGTKPLNSSGNALNNTLTGNGSNNILNGGNGNDLLDGASGNDTLTGGAGADTFAFTTPLNALRNVDTITDFTSGTDRIQLAPAIFRDMGFSGSPGSDAFFHLGATAQDADDRILYDQAVGSLYYDADGAGALAAVQFATLLGSPLLTYSDIYVG